ncbi:MAG: hypothetical protein WCC01_11205 [Acidimicrobiia bacterium]
MNDDRGAALIGTLAIAFVFVLVVVQTLITVGRLGASAAEASEVATYAAQHGARHGDPGDARRLASALAPDAVVIAIDDGDLLSVEVRIDVPLIGPEGSPLHHTVTGRASATYSPYRSRP